MSENENATVSVEDLLIAEAQAEASKPPRTKKTVVLASIVEFVNSENKTWMHVEQRYPSLTKATLKNYIRENTALDGLVYPIQHDDFGLCLVKIS